MRPTRIDLASPPPRAGEVDRRASDETEGALASAIALLVTGVISGLRARRIWGPLGPWVEDCSQAWG